jgi:hypothetical protein
MQVSLDSLRRMTPGEKIAATLRLSGIARQLSEAGVRLSHPKADDREVFLRAAARRLDRDTMIRVYGWDPKANE